MAHRVLYYPLGSLACQYQTFIHRHLVRTVCLFRLQDLRIGQALGPLLHRFLLQDQAMGSRLHSFHLFLLTGNGADLHIHLLIALINMAIVEWMRHRVCCLLYHQETIGDHLQRILTNRMLYAAARVRIGLAEQLSQRSWLLADLVGSEHDLNVDDWTVLWPLELDIPCRAWRCWRAGSH